MNWHLCLPSGSVFLSLYPHTYIYIYIYIYICEALLVSSSFPFYLSRISLSHPECEAVTFFPALKNTIKPFGLKNADAKDIQCLLSGHHRHGWRHAVSCSSPSDSDKALLTNLSFGFDISSISAIIGTQQYVDYFNNPAGTTQGGIGAALAGGSVIGAIMAGPVSNRIGRRDAIAFACFWWLLGTAIQAGCNGVGMLVAGRFINGICVGITSSQVPVYLVEITKKERRGSIVVIQQWAIEWGIFIMYFVGYGMLLLNSFHLVVVAYLLCPCLPWS